ncbi:hypothetical protein ADUPG1_006255 [Aduncisulcus paluster]|uniref:Uncharacterized protein n=1 Tax=Aduncisulcus paluster TaxID=2918883 RepID=A0ABQ5KHE4_9EUKA|nr:hypothetical protein ADUPG1_006255 [Aduncisulcus paluster]
MARKASRKPDPAADPGPLDLDPLAPAGGGFADLLADPTDTQPTGNRDPSDIFEFDDMSNASDTDLARFALRLILQDKTAPAASRAAAARTLAEMAGALGRHAPPPSKASKPITEMTREELEAELNAGDSSAPAT